MLRCDGAGRARLWRGDQCLQHFSSPLAALEWLDDQRRQSEAHRWAGFLGYGLGGWFEPAVRSRLTAADEGVPLFAFGRVPVNRDPQRSVRRPPATPAEATPRSQVSSFTRPGYLAAVRRCIDYIAAGDVFQVNLSQQLTLDYEASADELYSALAPAAYGALLDLGDCAILSNSPELFLHVTGDGRILTRPIKGTRPRGEGMRSELLASEKDAAELNMIVDLERNDLGRVCEVGSVRVTQPRTIEAHPTIYHGVATIEGQLRGDVGLVELLTATFPSGSVTGAPKIRAMQIIDELEPVPRGPYCGAVGYLDADGSLQLNVAIRTATLARGRLNVPVGGGIVADSDPTAEYEETLVKARAILAATVRAAARGAGS